MNETKSVLELVHKTRLILLVCIVIDRISCFWQMHKLLKFHLIVITRNRLISLTSSILGRTEHTLANIVGIFVLFIRSYLVLCGEIQMQSVLDRFLLQETSRISTSLFKNGFVRTMLPLRGKREQIITLSELVFAQELLEEVGLGCYLLVCPISSKSASLEDWFIHRQLLLGNRLLNILIRPKVHTENCITRRFGLPPGKHFNCLLLSSILWLPIGRGLSNYLTGLVDLLIILRLFNLNWLLKDLGRASFKIQVRDLEWFLL